LVAVDMVDRGENRGLLGMGGLAPLGIVLLAAGFVGCTATGGGPPPVSKPPSDEGERTARALAESSPVVLRARVVKTNASDEPMLAASPTTIVVSVQELYAGAEIAGEQRGRTATIVLTRPDPRLKEGTDAFFFGAPRFVGAGLTIAGQAELVGAANGAAVVDAIRRGVRARQNAPLFEGLTNAALVFRGTVEKVQPVTGETPAPGTRPGSELSEHDPEWQVAKVRLTTPLRGGVPGSVVTVVFPGSRDIVWFRAPKLEASEDAVFVVRALTSDERARYREPALLDLLKKQQAYFVLRPVDVQPAAAEARLRRLLAGDKETP
jgi:hypothetical protein